MTEPNEDTKRFEFLAKSLNSGAKSVHIAVRPDTSKMQIYTWLSKWAETSAPDKITLDDLRFLIDQAIAQAEEES